MEPGDEGPKLQFDPGLARTLVEFLRQPAPVERGGVLLGRRSGTKIHGSLVIFPPQLAHASSHCAFAVNAIEILRNASDMVEPADAMRPVEKIVGWVHTHPTIGLYLSNTDVTTFATWTHLDADTVAVVIDPYLAGDELDRIGWWAAPDGDAPVEPGPRTADRQRVSEVEPAEADTLSWAESGLLAEAIGREGNGGRWEIVSATGAHSVFPRPQRRPEPLRRADPPPEPVDHPETRVQSEPPDAETEEAR
ncbi:hypothetical protein DMB66_18770 [Actinoplanes sp. ATCC 53533]|uniref:Mov34/MPN/PAD-1 family protein n=1 Tax=Actinoplanes sp. ATCC 53533 TaxID=1288362 RepID=UPI000F77DEC4|nr:Mov34/MPN/PAD-1 family protein [Actinoplanes sp. ATCC 53533]RSM64691.1 hypothetical protein DMB66_18770 [Actinoplanes sp. ATCC 53533]